MAIHIELNEPVVLGTVIIISFVLVRVSLSIDMICFPDRFDCNQNF